MYKAGGENVEEDISEIEFVKSFIESSILEVMLLDNARRIAHINSNAASALKINKNDFIGTEIFNFLIQNFSKVSMNIDAFCKNPKVVVTAYRNGKCFQLKCFPLKIRRQVGYIVLFEDITKERREHESVVYGARLINSVVEFVPDILFVIDTSGRVIVWNKACEKFLGIKKAEIIGKGNYAYAVPFYGERRPILIDMALAGKKLRAEDYEKLEQNGDTFTGITEKGNLNGKKRVLWGKATRFYDADGNVLGAMEIVRDITAMKEKEEMLKKLAERDALTNAYNRRMLYTLLEREVDRIKRNGHTIAVIYIDVDNLSLINNTHGHKVGDFVLTETTKTLFSNLRKTDIVARIGGDEFIVVMPDMKKEDAEKVISRIRDILSEKSARFPFKMDFSFGAFQISPEEVRNTEDIISLADKEMYKMKNKKKRLLE